MPLAAGGFGQEVRDAMTARAEHLAAEGLAQRQGTRIVMQRDLLATLRRRELDAVGARLSTETGLPYTPAAGGETVAGTYCQRLPLTSGRFAMIDNGLGFALVPWTPERGCASGYRTGPRTCATNVQAERSTFRINLEKINDEKNHQDIRRDRVHSGGSDDRRRCRQCICRRIRA
jgi:hypothetical protein